jgi:hypothetical protein
LVSICKIYERNMENQKKKRERKGENKKRAKGNGSAQQRKEPTAHPGSHRIGTSLSSLSY